MQNVSISFHIQVLFPSVFSLAHSGLPRQVIKPGASKLVECALPGRHWWAHHDFGPGTMVFCGFRMLSARKFCRVFLVHLAIHSKIYIVFLGRTQKVDQTKCRVYEGLLWESIQTSKTTGFSGVNLQSGQTGCACRPTISSSKSSVGDQRAGPKKRQTFFNNCLQVCAPDGSHVPPIPSRGWISTSTSNRWLAFPGASWPADA